eukprot:2905050-Prymnesium_polylepis.1
MVSKLTSVRATTDPPGASTTHTCGSVMPQTGGGGDEGVGTGGGGRGAGDGGGGEGGGGGGGGCDGGGGGGGE